MHKFLRAVGFSDIKKNEIEEIIQDIVDAPNVMKITTDSEGNEFAEMSGECGEGFGIVVRGTYNEKDEFSVDHYFPYLKPADVSTEEYVEIEKHADKESYAGVCDELRLGVTLIFYLLNVSDFLAERKLYGSKNTRRGAMLSALACEGKILLPIAERPKAEPTDQTKKTEHDRLIAQAREGNEEAIENLTIEDMDTYNILSQRIHNEDVLSIVSTSFMPYGIESDQYSIIGDILDLKVERNRLTEEEIYLLRVRCNDILIKVCINKKDLLGQPMIGRRFKGNIWLQGETL